MGWHSARLFGWSACDWSSPVNRPISIGARNHWSATDYCGTSIEDTHACSLHTVVGSIFSAYVLSSIPLICMYIYIYIYSFAYNLHIFSFLNSSFPLIRFMQKVVTVMGNLKASWRMWRNTCHTVHKKELRWKSNPQHNWGKGRAQVPAPRSP